MPFRNAVYTLEIQLEVRYLASSAANQFLLRAHIREPSKCSQWYDTRWSLSSTICAAATVADHS
jgi:hypothetical protein